MRAGFFFPEKKGTIYAKASVAHDFKGDMESFAYLDEPYTPTATLKDELGGTWYEFGSAPTSTGPRPPTPTSTCSARPQATSMRPGAGTSECGTRSKKSRLSLMAL